MTDFLRIGPAGAERPAIRTEHGLFDLSGLTPDLDGRFLAAGGLAAAQAAAREGSLPRLEEPDGARLGAPVARPGALLCIGQNYAAHAAESGSTPPTRPIVFLKHPNTVVGPFDDVRRPARALTLDWEVELAAVIGRAAWEVPVEHALEHVAGYLVANDVSERTWQREESGGQWSKGKIAPTFCPLGPALVPADEVDPTALRIWSRVNGEPRQDSSTADLVFPVAELIADLSRYVRLDPGDVLLTGTPEGVAMSGRFPYLRDGDVVEIGVEGLGAQRTVIVPA